MAGYIRQSTFVDGDTITAALFNNEYNQLVNVFSNTSGHKHDGTTAEGPVIGLIGDAGETSPNNKVLIDTTNNYIEFYVEVSSAPVQQLYIADGAIIPVTDNDIDLGTSSLEFKDIYIDGTATIDTLTVDEAATIGTTLGVTGATTLSSTLGVTGATTLSSTLAVTGATTLSSTLAVTGTSTLTGNVTTTNDLSVGGNLTVTGNATISGNLTFGDADTDSINLAAEIDSDIIPNTDGTYDLGSATKEWQDLYIDGTANIDSLIADTADINGGTIDGATIGGTTPAAGTFTTLTANTSITGTLATAAQPNITSVGTLTGLTTTGDINFGDNDKAIFGAGSDLKIYHNGTNSFIDEVGTGILYIRAATDLRLTNANSSKLYANFEDGGASKLYYDNGLKLLTTSAGVDITGTLTTSSTINVNSSSGYGNLELGGASGGFIDFKTPFSDDHDARIIYAGSFLQISTANDEPILLKHNNVDKLVTSSAGITITGRTLVSDDQTNDWIKQEVSGTTSTISLGNTESTGGTAQWSYNRSSGGLSGNIGSAAGTNFMTVQGTGKIGFGTDSPDGKVHIFSSSAGTVTAANDADDLVLESSTNVGMTLLTGNSSQCRIRFGDADSNARGNIFYNHNSDSFGFQTAGSTKLTLTQDGELGVGTTNPLGTLHVNGDIIADANANNGFGFERSGVAYSMLELSATGADELSLYNKLNNDLLFGTNGTERARIDNAGNFGIGTTSPARLLHISGTDSIQLELEQTDASSDVRMLLDAGGTSGQVQFAGASHASVPNTLSLVSAADTRFVQAGQTVMHIDSASGGQVIIGGTAALGNATFTVDSDSAAIACFDGSSANGGYLQFRNNNTAKGVLGFGSNAGASSTDAMILGSTSGNVEFHANNSEVMKATSDGVEVTGEILGKTFAYSYYNSSSTTLTTSYAVVNLDTLQASTGISGISISSNVVTVSRSGTFMITMDIVTDVTSGSARSVSEAQLYKNGSAVTGTFVGMYNRQIDKGLNTGSATTMISVSSGDTFEIRAKKTGSDTVVTSVGGTRLTFLQVGN